jgi:uncharacterized protein (UPF0276 family)
VNNAPAYGVGLAYRKFFHSDILANRDSIDFLELPTIDYVERSRRILGDPSGAYMREIREALPCVAHGISLSVGSVEPPAENILRETRAFLDEFEVAEFSDHLTFHRMGDQDLTVFMSMPFEDEAAQWIANQFNECKRILGQPFGLEIVTYTFPVAASKMTEVEFINRIAEYCDCWFLFDAANLFFNSTNHKYDPVKYLEKLNGERVLHMHMAGGHYEDGEWIDSHSQPVTDEVFEVLELALQQTSARAIILERDDEPGNFGFIIDDLERAREIFYKYRPEEPPEELVKHGTPTFEASRALPDIALDKLPPHLKGMRAYQEALITCAFDMANGKHQNRSKDEIIALYDMPREWKARWSEMDWKQMLNLKRKMGFVQEFEENAARFYRMVEMQEWAQQLGPDEFFKGAVGR